MATLGGKFVIVAPAGLYHGGSGVYEIKQTEAETALLAWRNLLQDFYNDNMLAYAISQGYRLRKRRTAK